MVRYGKSGHSRAARPHGRKKSRGGGIRMKGYSKYAAEGKGLSDVGYARWVTAETKAKGHVVVVNPASYLMGMAKLGTPVGWAGKPGYKGSGLEARVKQAAIMSRGMVGEQTVSHTPSSGFGRAAMGGMGRGEWERPQIKKEEAKTGAAGVGTVVAIGGVGYLLWSLLK